MNGFGERKFLNDGSFVSSTIDQLIDKSDPKEIVTNNCTEISCDVISPRISPIENLPPGENLSLFCIGKQNHPYYSLNYNWEIEKTT